MAKLKIAEDKTDQIELWLEQQADGNIVVKSRDGSFIRDEILFTSNGYKGFISTGNFKEHIKIKENQNARKKERSRKTTHRFTTS